ncbi:MAG: PTS sugar transporter subunit IIA [Chloroflexi bacterium]|nr:PTS sugar transporter subunit IIA [Chloroflexota bacterium]
MEQKPLLPKLSELLISERIETGYQTGDWKDAVREAGKLLYKTGIVKEEYIEAMVETCQELGPYIVIAKGIALPHAAPEKGALQTGLSMLALDPPVEFGNKYNDPVKLVIGLAALDHEMHIEALRSLAEIFIDEELRQKLLNADQKSEITEIILTFEQRQ